MWDERHWDHDGVFVNGSDVLSWVADDGRRRGDGAPVLVAHSTPDLARSHLADPDGARDVLVAELRSALAVPEPRHAEVHRWTFAKPSRVERDGRTVPAHRRGDRLLRRRVVARRRRSRAPSSPGSSSEQALVARFG